MHLDFQNVLDLSYVVDENSPCELPIDPAKIYDQATLEKDGYFESRIDTSGHYSTHMDAPCLMYPGGATIAEIPGMDWACRADGLLRDQEAERRCDRRGY